MPTYRLDLEYEGTRFQGWQEQKNARTAAGALREALKASGITVDDLMGAGRTDRGVHALQQTAHLRTARSLPELTRYRRELNDLVPPDLHVLNITPVSETFHARRDAQRRSYLYQIVTRRSAFARRHSWWVKYSLDVDAMTGAAALLIGRHDFTLLSEPAPEKDLSTIVVVEEVTVQPHEAAVLIRICASHFLYKMVRRTIGVLVKIGTGQLQRDDLVRLLALRARRELSAQVAEWTAPPAGLFLERVIYAGDPPLGPVRATLPVAREAVMSPPDRRSNTYRPGPTSRDEIRRSPSPPSGRFPPNKRRRS
ncbi:MAG: tRNA pseudouridine(38-40) synthase TruA [Acidobacteriota bacterium]